MTEIYHSTNIENAISILNDNELKCRSLLNNPPPSAFGSSESNENHHLIYLTSDKKEFGYPPKAQFVFDSDEVNAKEHKKGKNSSTWVVKNTLHIKYIKKVIVHHIKKSKNMNKLNNICDMKNIKYNEQQIKDSEFNFLKIFN